MPIGLSMLPLFFTLKPSKKDDTDDESNVIYLKDCINTDHGNVKDVHRNGIGIRSVAHGLNCYGRGQLGEKLITNLPGLGKALKTATEAKEIAERNNEDTKHGPHTSRRKWEIRPNFEIHWRNYSLRRMQIFNQGR